MIHRAVTQPNTYPPTFWSLNFDLSPFASKVKITPGILACESSLVTIDLIMWLYRVLQKRPEKY